MELNKILSRNKYFSINFNCNLIVIIFFAYIQARRDPKQLQHRFPHGRPAKSRQQTAFYSRREIARKDGEIRAQVDDRTGKRRRIAK